MAIYGRLDLEVLAIGLVLLAPSARPADAYLSVWRQRMLDLWSYSN